MLIFALWPVGESSKILKSSGKIESSVSLTSDNPVIGSPGAFEKHKNASILLFPELRFAFSPAGVSRIASKVGGGLLSYWG